MYESAASTVSADGNPMVHFLTVEEAEPADNFYQATTCFWRASLRLGCKLSPHAPSCSPLARYIHNNCLMLRAALGGNDTIVVPASATNALFDEFHQHHSGIPVLLQVLHYWPMLKQDIATWSLNFNCNRGKRGPDARQDLHPLPIVRPGERYHLDQIVMTNPSTRPHQHPHAA